MHLGPTQVHSRCTEVHWHLTECIGAQPECRKMQPSAQVSKCCKNCVVGARTLFAHSRLLVTCKGPSAANEACEKAQHKKRLCGPSKRKRRSSEKNVTCLLHSRLLITCKGSSAVNEGLRIAQHKNDFVEPARGKGGAMKMNVSKQGGIPGAAIRRSRSTEPESRLGARA